MSRAARSLAAIDELPQAREAACSVLAAMMLGDDAIRRARAELGPLDFYFVAHQKIYSAILALADRGEPADSITVSQELENHGDLEAAGGRAKIAEILEYATTTANVEAYARIVREAATRRRFGHLGLDLLQRAADPTQASETILEHVVCETAAIAAAQGDKSRQAVSLVDCGLTLREATARPEPEYRSVFRAGGMPFGFYGIVHGDGGVGKTRECFRAVVLRTLERPWHRWDPSEEVFRPLVLSLEIGRAAATKLLEKIARDIGGAEAWEAVADQVRVIGAPEYVESLHAGPAAREELLEAIARHGSNFVLIDSLSEIKGGSGGEGPEDYAPAIEMLKYVSRATESHVEIIHHNRRLPAGAKATGTPADQIRGPASLLNASRWACAIDTCRGKRRITWYRVSFGLCPADSYFAIDDDGLPHDDTAPDDATRVGETNRARVLAVISAAGDITRKHLEEATGLSESAVGDHLRDLLRSGQVAKSPGKIPTYRLPCSRPPELGLGGSEGL